MSTPIKCPICLNEHGGKCREHNEEGENRAFDCDVCGRFRLTESLFADSLDPKYRDLSSLQRASLSHLVRTAFDANNDVPKLDAYRFDDFIKRGNRLPTPALQAINIIRFIGDHFTSTGNRLKRLPIHFYASVGSPNPECALGLISELKEKNLISGSAVISGGTREFLKANLTLAGWQEYESQRSVQTAGRYGFLAMKFADPILDPFAKNVIKPCVKEEIGFSLQDMRDVAQAGVIDNLLRAQIRDAAFVLVDLTHDNYGAYWESGYAEGLGKPVIYLCERSKFDDAKTHFDTNHCTTVLWSTDKPQEFQSELIATLRRSLNLF